MNSFDRFHSILYICIVSVTIAAGMLVPSAVSLLELAGFFRAAHVGIEHGTVHLRLAGVGHHHAGENDGHHAGAHDDHDLPHDAGDSSHGTHLPTIERDGHLKVTSPLPILLVASILGNTLFTIDEPSPIPSGRIIPTAFSPPIELQRTVVLLI